MLVVLAALLSGQSADPPRLRELLPNGTAVVAERRPGADRASIVLAIASDPDTPDETAEKNGWRHLVEHLVARNDGTIDLWAESRGMVVLASTQRDAMIFEVRFTQGAAQDAATLLTRLCRPPLWTEDDLSREVRLIELERALLPGERSLLALTWEGLTDAVRPDPFGSSASLRAATPKALDDLWRGLLDQRSLAVAVVGDLDVDDGIRAARSVAQQFSSRAARPWTSKAFTGRVRSSNPEGTAVGLGVGGWIDPELPAVLAAGWALSMRSPGSSVVWTPTVGPGVVSLLLPLGAKLSEDSPDELFVEGRARALQWLDETVDTPSEGARVRAVLLAQNPNARIETLAERIRSIDRAAFAAALARWRTQ